MTTIDPYGQSSADDGLVATVRGAAAAELARRLGPARLFTPSQDDQALVWSVIAEQLAAAHRDHVLAGGVPLDDPARQRLGQTVFDALLGLGPLERYLANEDVEELLVNGHQRAFVLRSGGAKERVSTGFGSEAELRAFAARTVAVAGRRLDEANPKADARLPDGSRLHAICPPLTPFTCLTIRRHRLLAHTIQDLLALGTLTREVAGLLQAAVRAGLNLLSSGGTGSGKTTTLNAIASQIPPGQRVITIEETKELALERAVPAPRPPILSRQQRFDRGGLLHQAGVGVDRRATRPAAGATGPQADMGVAADPLHLPGVRLAEHQ
jgi:pilus assembly protein CpaF